ncbi:MAG: phosphoribosyltransferase [Betaproteobacteria bacterium]
MSATEQSDTDLWVDWDQCHRLIEQLIVRVHQSGWEFDQVLCLARGGMRIGDIFSRVFDRPLAILATSSYREDAGTKQGSLAIAPFVTMATGTLTGRILIVDDMVDSGQTFDLIRAHLLRTYPSIIELRSAVLWYKAHSVVTPDYFVQKLDHNPWIHQPFEAYDGMDVQDLVKKWS